MEGTATLSLQEYKELILLNNKLLLEKKEGEEEYLKLDDKFFGEKEKNIELLFFIAEVKHSSFIFKNWDTDASLEFHNHCKNEYIEIGLTDEIRIEYAESVRKKDKEEE